MTDEQKFLFDVRGWLLLPGVLTEPEIAAIKEHLLAGGDGFSGPAQELLDHPAIVPILNEILSERPLADDTYNFRCESSFVTIRKAGWQPGGTQVPHVVRPPQGSGPMNYRCNGGRIYSALTRVVWELNPVEEGDGGTLFLTGSHKAAFPAPPSIQRPDSPLWETYSCPPGSVLFFTEALTHSGAVWTRPDRDRVAIFNCYNTINSKWHEWQPHPELLAAMPPLRRTLFRSVHAQNNAVTG